MKKQFRILFIEPGPQLPPEDESRNRYHCLSTYFSGDILSTTWWKKRKERNEKIALASGACGNFDLHALRSYNGRLNILRPIVTCGYFVSKGSWSSLFHGRYDAIVAYGPFTTGLSALFLKWLTRTSCIIEVPGNFEQSNRFVDGTPSFDVKVKRFIGSSVANFVLNRADHVKLLYPPLDSMSKRFKRGISVFHNFVGIKQIQARSRQEREPNIILLGHPWYLKGVDLLIKAFHEIKHEFPEHRLMIAGYCWDKTPFEKLRDGDKRIQLLQPLPHPEAIELIARSELFVLPSRTEGMGRVLLEAMAAKTPIVASNVDGIPHYVEHGETGLLVDSENVEQLASAMRKALGDRKLANKMADKAYRRVFERYSEERFARHYFDMVERVMSHKSRDDVHQT